MSDKIIPKESIFYVYVLIDPRNNLPFYVGKGKNERVVRHFYNWRSIDKSNPHKARKIKKLKELGYTPMYEIIFESSNEELVFEKEKQLIAKWGRVGYEKDGILTNVNPGGEGNTGGQKHVKQYNLFGEFIQTFSSCLEAAYSMGKKNSSSIIECCKKRGGQKAAWGYFWCYAEEELDLNWCFGGKKKPVYQWDLNGNFVARFVNANQAARCIQKPKSSKEIIQCCKTSGICQQFQWTFNNNSPGKYIKVKTPRPNCIKINQWSLNGDFIKTYNSFYEANIALDKKGRDNEISKGIKNNKCVYGFNWTIC